MNTHGFKVTLRFSKLYLFVTDGDRIATDHQKKLTVDEVVVKGQFWLETSWKVELNSE